MTEPSQYFKGRTVQEQMNEVIGYVDTRSAEVAVNAIAADVAQVHQDMLDADADASAAAASAAAAAGTLANAVKKTGESSQSIAGDIAVSGNLTGGTVTVPTPVNNTDAANKKYVDDQDALKLNITDVNQYAVGLTGNQSINGVKTFETAPELILGAGGKRITSTDYLKIGMINNASDNNYVVGLIIMERGGIVIGNLGITVSGGAVASVSLSGTTLVGSSVRIYGGAAKTADGVEIYCHTDTTNRFFSANIIGCFAAAGLVQPIIPESEIKTLPSGYVEAQFTEA